MPGDRFADAAAALHDLGYQRRSVELRPGFDRRFGKGATFHRKADANIDLHRTFVAGPYAFLIDPGDLFDHPTEFEVSGNCLEALSPEAGFIHSCISATLSDAQPKLITLRDVVQTYRNPELDADEVRRLCDAWRIGHVVNTTTATVNTVLGLPESERLRTDLAAPGASDPRAGGSVGLPGKGQALAPPSAHGDPVRAGLVRPCGLHPGGARIEVDRGGLTSHWFAEHHCRSARGDPTPTLLEPPRVPAEHDAPHERALIARRSFACRPCAVAVGPRVEQCLQAVDVEHLPTRRDDHASPAVRRRSRLAQSVMRSSQSGSWAPSVRRCTISVGSTSAMAARQIARFAPSCRRHHSGC